MWRNSISFILNLHMHRVISHTHLEHFTLTYILLLNFNNLIRKTIINLKRYRWYACYWICIWCFCDWQKANWHFGFDIRVLLCFFCVVIWFQMQEDFRRYIFTFKGYHNKNLIQIGKKKQEEKSFMLDCLSSIILELYQSFRAEQIWMLKSKEYGINNLVTTSWYFCIL